MSSLASPGWGFEGYKLWKVIYDKRVITSDGVYAEGQVPVDYAGAELEVEFHQLMIFATPGGRFLEWGVFDYAEVMDKDKKKGIGYTYTPTGGGASTLGYKDVDAKGPSTHKTEWYDRVLSDNFDPVDLSKVDYMYGLYLAELKAAEAP